MLGLNFKEPHSVLIFRFSKLIRDLKEKDASSELTAFSDSLHSLVEKGLDLDKVDGFDSILLTPLQSAIENFREKKEKAVIQSGRKSCFLDHENAITFFNNLLSFIQKKDRLKDIGLIDKDTSEKDLNIALSAVIKEFEENDTYPTGFYK